MGPPNNNKKKKKKAHYCRQKQPNLPRHATLGLLIHYQFLFVAGVAVLRLLAKSTR